MVWLGMSQSALSLATMVSAGTISQILSGRIRNSRFLDSIEHVLGLNVAEPSGAEPSSTEPSGAKLDRAEPSGAELSRAEPIGTGWSEAEPDHDDSIDAFLPIATAIRELDTLNSELRTLEAWRCSIERARDRAALHVARMRGFK